ncbi:Rqc2 family fibronectin-binding protein [Geochorda subterranea]|uniref:NFACT family protein n=1 Tax=Geochorda subterranea TaxID=3109564 RepID=A0ABZ1BLD7_9FIRM|nr:NFACT family protein [Limnochorda sp. LNt]WRP13398.1 NFACT family protein [Limnochorda sp. LNt]
MQLTPQRLAQLAQAIASSLAGAWVQRIYQPEASVLVFHLYGPGGERVLVADTTPGRLALGVVSGARPPNPLQPPAFCMLLRKHLEGSRLTGASAVPGDRVVLLRFRRASEPQAILALEMTGRTANVVLVVDGKVAGWLRAPGPQRALALHRPYAPPPPPPASPAARGPASGEEVPTLEAVGAWWAKRLCQDQVETRRRDLARRLEEQCRRLARRIARQEEDLQRAGEAERWRRAGELLLTFPHDVPPGATQVTLPPADRPTGEPPLTIELDPARSPAQNAAACFRRYQKARRAVAALEATLQEGRRRLEALQTLRVLVQTADDTDVLATLEAETEQLSEEPGHRRPPSAGERSRPASRARSQASRRTGDGMPVTRYRSSEGLEILVGRSAAANDHLTFHLARPEHLWLHARGLPGAHVVVRAEADQVGPVTLQEAAALAARYSAQGEAGVPVPVDYTRRRHVRKPPGAPPGFVVYDHERTVTVRPAPREGPLSAGSGAPR